MREATKFRRASRLLPWVGPARASAPNLLCGGTAGCLSEFLSRISHHGTISLFDDQFLVLRLRPQFVYLAARPANDNRIDSRRRSQAEMGARVTRTLEAV